MKYKPLSKSFYQNTRKSFMAEMEPNSLAIFNSNESFANTGNRKHILEPNCLFSALGVPSHFGRKRAFWQLLAEQMWSSGEGERDRGSFWQGGVSEL